MNPVKLKQIFSFHSANFRHFFSEIWLFKNYRLFVRFVVVFA